MNMLPQLNFLVYIFIGTLLSIVLYYIMQRNFFGRIYGAIIVGTIGAILGGNILQPILIKMSTFLQNEFKINLFATFLGTLLLLWIFKIVSAEIKKR